MKAFCINLKSRKDRKEKSQLEFAKHGLNVEYFNGIPAKIFGIKHKNTRFSEGMVGVFLSHYLLYRKIKEENLGVTLIMEDDIKLADDFKERLDKTINNLPENWDVCILGYYIIPGGVNKEPYNEHFSRVRKWFGLQGYLVNGKWAADKLINLIEEEGMLHQIDNQIAIYDKTRKLDVIFTNKPMVLQNGSKTDVQTI